MTAAKLRSTIAAAEKLIESCWSGLVSLKEAKPTTEFTLFQAHLADALMMLERARRQIIQDQKRLVERKSRYRAAWFRATMARLALQEKIH